MNKNLKKGLAFTLSFLSILVVVAATIGVARLSKFYYNWENPIGDEVLALMGKMKFIAHYFPHINWNHEWDAGQPGFWIYLPFSFFIGNLFVKFLNFTYAYSITLIGLISYILIAIGVWGITHRLAKNRLVALLAVALAITSQGIWYWDSAGYYARTFGMGFYFLAFWTGIAFVQKVEKQKKLFPLPKLEFFLTIIFFFLAGYSHAMPNYLTIGTLALLFLMALSGWQKKLLAIFFVIGTGFFLSAFYFFLMLQANFQYYGRLFFHRVYGPHPLRLFWNLEVFEGFAGAPEVSPLILPLVAALGLWFIFSRRRFKGFIPAEKKILWLIIFFFAVSVYYPLQGSLYLPKLFYIFLLPCDATFFISVFGAILISVFLSAILRNFSKLWQYFVPAVFLGLMIVSTARGAFFIFEDKWPRRLTSGESSGFLERMVIDPESKQYRMGTTNPLWAESFNYFYEVPQNRDYFAQGVVYDDWQFWQNAAIWSKEYGYPETDFLIDWYSIKWILSTASATDSSYEKFSAEPEKYELVYEEPPNYFEFIPKEVSPILTATNAANILVIGNKKTAYDLFIRSAALVDLNSQSLIPVRGREEIDYYRLDELKQFDVIYLYDYDYKSRQRTSNLLKKYVEDGGGLIVEGALSPENKQKSNQALFEPLPQTEIIASQVKGDWQFQIQEHPITRGINLKAFDPALYEDSDPWKIVLPAATAGFETLLTSKGEPILLSKELGSGRVVWMGFNLNYHISTNQNIEEMEFFKNIINWVSQDKIDQIPTASCEAKFIHPEKREIVVNSQASGILNKEYYFPAWKAYFRQGGKKKELKIYRGGLDQQYIPLPADLKPPYIVVMTYGRWPAELVGFVVSGFTLVILIIYLFEGIFYPPFIGKVWEKIFGRIRLKVPSWWEDDEV